MAPTFKEKLIAAGLAAGTDKISIHHYEQAFSRHLEPFCDQQDFGMVEIGYGSGSGVTFWTGLFPHGYLYCLDRDVEESGSRYAVIKADQSSIQDLTAAQEAVHHVISLIVDDGSHLPSHQLFTFSFLFQTLLQEGGIYIIEDIETSFWRSGSIYGYTFNYGLHDPWSTIEAFKLASDYVNRRYLSSEDQSFIEYRLMSIGLDPVTVQQIEGIEFSRNCIVIRKSSVSAYQEQEYPHQNAIKRF